MKKELTLEEARKDILKIEFYLREYLQIKKLSWPDDSLVPDITLSFNAKNKEVQEEAKDAFEKKLGDLYFKYKHLYPSQEKRYMMYQYYYNKFNEK